jgi:hypothetical protein
VRLLRVVVFVAWQIAEYFLIIRVLPSPSSREYSCGTSIHILEKLESITAASWLSGYLGRYRYRNYALPEQDLTYSLDPGFNSLRDAEYVKTNSPNPQFCMIK